MKNENTNPGCHIVIVLNIPKSKKNDFDLQTLPRRCGAMGQLTNHITRENRLEVLAATDHDAVPASGAACSVSYKMSPPIFKHIHCHITSNVKSPRSRKEREKFSRNLITAHTTS